VGKKKEIDLKNLRTKPLLEELVRCSRLGRMIASYGATLTGREKHDAKVLYLLLKSRRKPPTTTLATARISREYKRKKKYTPTEAMKWFIDEHSTQAKPLIKRLEKNYNSRIKSLAYGIQQGQDFSDEEYIDTLISILEMSKEEASMFYYSTIKPQFQRMKEEEGIIRMNMEQS